MRKVALLLTVFALTISSAPNIQAQTDHVKYVPKYEDPVLKEMGKKADTLKDIRDSITEAIRDSLDDEKELKKERDKTLRFDLTNIVKPASPDVFRSQFHFPPVAQYRTGTCWSFSTVSFLESEVFRLTGRKIKLSEIYPVYHEYIAKARRYIQRRGDFDLGEGAESNDVMVMMKQHGLVPEEVYPGIVEGVRHDHKPLSDEIRSYLAHVKDQNLWDEAEVIAHVKVILNWYLGEPPESFTFEGKTMTPLQFMSETLKLNPDDYISVMSTLSIPFYTMGVFDVPDNWWRDSSYYNLPVDEWYAVIKKAITDGYTMAIGGDNSEPGWNGFENVDVIPDFDVPRKYINQDSREFRINNGTTTDNHGLHLVGYTTVDGRDWFLIKDSGRSARWGKFEGYYFMRDDYIRMKMLTITIHKDAMREVLKKFSTAEIGG
jgi:bleomycin hydrolase